MNVGFQRRVDRWVGVPLCRLLSLWPGSRRPPQTNPPPKRILVILLSEMGSLVLADPMFRRLEREYPDASLYALVFEQNKEVLDLLGVVPEENIVTIRNRSLSTLLFDGIRALRKLRRLGVDTALDCELFSRVSAILSFASGARRRVGFERHTQEGLYRGDFINCPVPYNPYQHIAHQFSTLVEAIEAGGRPRVKRVTSEDEMWLRPFRPKDGEVEAMRARLAEDFPAATGRLVLVYPGGGLLPIRAWPRESYETLIAALRAEGFDVGIIGLDADKALARAIQAKCGANGVLDLTGYTKSVRELLLVFHLAELLVTNDGGPGHFAAMTPTPSIVLYGPETPVLYGSLDPASHHFYENLSCSPCVTAYNHRASPCDGDNQCLKRIEPEAVLATALEVLNRGPA